MDVIVERPLTREELLDAYESLLGQISGLEARKNQLKAQLKETQEAQKAIKAQVREVCWLRYGTRRVHYRFEGDSTPEKAIDVEATTIGV
jgi:predicted phage-related endonuclease